MSEPIDLGTLRTLDDVEAAAKRRLSHMAYEYIAGGVADEVSAADNRAAFERIKLKPRTFVDVSRLETGIRLFGRRHPHPILLSPTGYHKLAHPLGERETVRGAALAEATLIAAAFATTSYEDMKAESQMPLWFQLYLHPDRGVTRDLLETVLAAGCEAICLTTDVPVNGARDRELRAGFHLPAGVERSNLAQLGSKIADTADRPYGRDIYSVFRAADATWKDLDWLRSLIPVPLLLKGVVDPDDAARAVSAGCDGLIVSNHGGRSLDTVPATVDIFRVIHRRLEGRVPLIVDGGIRRGTDVFKALALGATAVAIGRSYLFGLAVGGGEGIARVIEILRTELEMSMGLLGCARVSNISTDYLWRSQLDSSC